MICRYCGNSYATEEPFCHGCGAPKTRMQQVLDVPAAPDHWINSFTESVQRVLLVTLGIGVVTAVLALIGLESMGAVLAFFWGMAVTPCVLGYAAWRSACGKIVPFLGRLFAAWMLWGGIFATMMLVIGVTMSG